MLQPPADIEETIQWAAKAEKVPAAIVRSVAYHESRYDPSAISPAGAKGLMQLMPVVIEQYGVTDPFDPDQSARVGAHLLSVYKTRFGDWPTALAAYNWGTGNVSKNPSSSSWPTSTQKYVNRVLADAGIVDEKSGNMASLLFALAPVALILGKRFFR